MKLGGCQVLIKCNDRAVGEIDTIVGDDGESVSCYIASQPGKEFFIEYSRNLNYGPPATDLTADVFFDGVQAGPGWIAPDPKPWEKRVIGDVRGARHGDTLHKYAFTKPELIDGETPSSINPDQMGEIRVRLGFVAKHEPMEEGARQLIPHTGPPQVNEKDKKPGVHCANVVAEESLEECTEPVFLAVTEDDDDDKDTLRFVFKCRADEWLQAEGLIRKSRRQRGKPEQAEDQEMKPLPKPEPLEEVVPTGEVLAGGMGVSSPAGPPPQPRSSTPLSYADEPIVRRGEKAHPTPQPTEQGQPQGNLFDSIALERPRKFPRRSGDFTSTIGGESQSVITSMHSIQRSPAEGAGSGPGVKVEEGGSVPGLKEEVGETKVSNLNEDQTKKRKLEELEEQISKLKKERDEVLGGTVTSWAQKPGTKTKYPRRKTKAERESARPPTPEVIDLTD